jgi:hypothetical protein
VLIEAHDGFLERRAYELLRDHPARCSVHDASASALPISFGELRIIVIAEAGQLRRETLVSEIRAAATFTFIISTTRASSIIASSDLGEAFKREKIPAAKLQESSKQRHEDLE